MRARVFEITITDIDREFSDWGATDLQDAIEEHLLELSTHRRVEVEIVERSR